MKEALIVAGAVLALVPVVHTEWHKYRATRIAPAMHCSEAGGNPQVGAELRRRREEAASAWKLWKSVSAVAGILLAALSGLLGG